MRSLALVCVLLCSVVSTAQSIRAAKQVDDSHYELDFRRHGEVRMHIQPSALQISGSDDDKIKVHYWSDREDTSDVKVRLESSGNTANVYVGAGPQHDVHVEIQVPKKSDLYLRIMAGKVDIDNVAGDKNIELSAGDLTVQVAMPATTARLKPRFIPVICTPLLLVFPKADYSAHSTRKAPASTACMLTWAPDKSG